MLNGFAKWAALGQPLWRADRFTGGDSYSSVGVAADGHIYMTGTHGDVPYLEVPVTARLDADGTSFLRLCSSCGGGVLSLVVGPSDELVFVQKSNPGVEGPADGIAVIDGHAPGPTPRIIAPPFTGTIAFAPDRSLVLFGRREFAFADPLTVTKLTLAGVEIWRTAAPQGLTFGVTSMSEIAVAADGTIAFVARLSGYGAWGMDQVDAGPGGTYLVGVTAAGEPKWARALPVSAGELPGELSVAAAGLWVYLASPHGCNGYTLEQIDTAGTVTASATFTTSQCREILPGTGILRLAATNNAVFMRGALAGSIDLGGGTVLDASEQDTAFLLKLTPPE